MFRTTFRAASLALTFTLPALAAADGRDWARAVAAARAAGPLSAAIIDWERLRDGQGSFAEYRAFLSRYPDWPGLPYLRKRGEGTLDGVPGEDVIAFFKGHVPQTGTGSLALIAALDGAGRTTAARDEAVRAWRTLSMTADEHARFIALYAPILAAHHDGRTAAMLRAGLTADARRMLPLASAYTGAIAAARVALQADDKGVDTLIAAVPEKGLSSGGLAYDRFRWRIRKDLYDSAGDLLLERLKETDTPVEYHLWRGVTHACLPMVRDLKAGRGFLQEIADFLKRAAGEA